MAVAAAAIFVCYHTSKGRVIPGARGGEPGIAMWAVLSVFIGTVWIIGFESAAAPFREYLDLHCIERGDKLICDKWSLPPLSTSQIGGPR